MAKRFELLAAAALFSVLLFSPNAHADRYFDLYAGVADTGGTTVSADYQLITILGATARQTARREADFDSSAAFGIRARWFLEEPAWFGFALGVGYYQADGDSVDIDVIPFSGLLMVRRPSPEGFEPYAGLGLTYAYADVDLEFFPELPAQVSGSANGIGPDLRLGFTWNLSPRWGLFAEYRYIDIDMEMDDADDWAFFSEEVMEADFDLATSFVVGGVSLRF